MSESSIPINDKLAMKQELARDIESNNELATAPSGLGEGENITVTHDVIFGDITPDGPNYRSVRVIITYCHV